MTLLNGIKKKKKKLSVALFLKAYAIMGNNTAVVQGWAEDK